MTTAARLPGILAPLEPAEAPGTKVANSEIRMRLHQTGGIPRTDLSVNGRQIGRKHLGRKIEEHYIAQIGTKPPSKHTCA
jgi:hypothetical protein